MNVLTLRRLERESLVRTRSHTVGNVLTPQSLAPSLANAAGGILGAGAGWLLGWSTLGVLFGAAIGYNAASITVAWMKP